MSQQISAHVTTRSATHTAEPDRRRNSAALTASDAHKLRPEALLVRRWHGGDGQQFGLAATWPDQHPYYIGVPGAPPSPMMVVETLRQAVIVTAHRGFGVSHSTAFVMSGIGVQVNPTSGLLTGETPVEITLSCSKVTERAGVLRSLRADLTFRSGGQIFAQGYGDLVLLPEQTYRRLRGECRESRCVSSLVRVPACRASVRDERDVVLNPSGIAAWRLALDTQHPYLFDHGSDHVPGMVLLEAARQAYSIVWSGTPMASMNATFSRYAEFTPEVELRYTGQDQAGTHFEASQQQHAIADFTMAAA